MADTTLIAAEVNCTTGEEIVRPFTPEEVEAHKAMQAAAEAQRAADEAAAKAAAEAKASAEAKLAALGLTADEIAALSK